jgi:hypothetical protein
MEPQEDAKDTHDERIYDALVVHMSHVRRAEMHPDTCYICRAELDMVRG